MGHERWWSKPKNHHGERHAPAARRAAGIRARGGNGLATVCHGTAPAFTPRAGVALRRAIAEATDALEGMLCDELVTQR
jgi:hypothetical protein